MAACGNDTLSRAEFVSKAEAICAKGGAELQRKNAEVFGDDESAQPTDEQIRSFVVFAGENANGQLDDIDALRPPKTIEHEVNLALRDGRAMLREFTRRAKANPKDLDAIEEEASKLVHHHLSDLGADSCP